MSAKIRIFIITITIGITGFFPYMPIIHDANTVTGGAGIDNHVCGSSTPNSAHHTHEMLLCIQAIHDISIGKIHYHPIETVMIHNLTSFWEKDPKESWKEYFIVYFHPPDPPSFYGKDMVGIIKITT